MSKRFERLSGNVEAAVVGAVLMHGEARDDGSWQGVLFGGREACAVLVPAKWC